MNYNRLDPFDTTNGEGIRVSLWVSGCIHNCAGCFNPEAQNFRYGQEFTDQTLLQLLHCLKDESIDGLSILGGDPLAPMNRQEVLEICAVVKTMFPQKTVWVWTGYTYEEVQEQFPQILKVVDVLIDGRFEEELKDERLEYRGSSNQKIIRLTK